MRAGLGERPRGFPAQPCRGSGDDADLAGQVDAVDDLECCWCRCHHDRFSRPGPNSHRRHAAERLMNTMTAMPEPLILPIRGRAPSLHAESWVAPNASVIGQVTSAARASVWYGATLRAEAEPIEIGVRHQHPGRRHHPRRPGFPVTIGASVSVGHNAVLHGCDGRGRLPHRHGCGRSSTAHDRRRLVDRRGRRGAAGLRRTAAVAGGRRARQRSRRDLSDAEVAAQPAQRARSTSGSSSCTVTQWRLIRFRFGLSGTAVR